MVTGTTAGTHTIVPGAFLSQNFDISYGLGTLTIKPATLTITSETKEMIYGQPQPVYTAVVDGFKYEENTASVINSTTYKLKDSQGALKESTGIINAGTYDILPTVTLIESGLLPPPTVNYILKYEFGKLTVGKSRIAITADTQTKTYGDADPALTFTITLGTLTTGDSFTGTMKRAEGNAVGNYAVGQETLLLSDNYALTFTGSNFSITPRPVTVTADAKNKVYGNPDPSFTYQITTGNLAYDDLFTGSLQRAADTSGKLPESAGTYAIGQGTLALNTNYALTYAGADLTITTRSLMVTADAKTKVYGDLDPVLTYQITSGSLAFSDAFTGTLSRDAGESVGLYPIQQNTLALNANYVLTYAGANLEITIRGVAVTADARIKVYGNPDPTLTYKISDGSLAFNDAFTGVLSRINGESVGLYAIQQNTLALNANYALTFTGANLEITARSITVTADAKSKIYGSTDPALTYQVLNGPLAYSDAFTGMLTRAAGENAGTYTITQGTLALSSNYALYFFGANLKITQASLVVKANDVTIITGQTPAFTSTITGFVNGDNQDIVVYGGPDYVVSGDYTMAGSYSITPSNLQFYSPANYIVSSYVNGTLTVNNGCTSTTRSIRPELECVEELFNHPSGFRYVAHFEYENENGNAIFIPNGPDNRIVSEGSFSGQPPELFPSGEGTFDVYFTGSKLTWTITSCDRGKKTAVASNASSSSARCKKGNGVLQHQDGIGVFPNQVVDYLILTFDESMLQPAPGDITIVDANGLPQTFNSTWYPESHQLRVDFTTMNAGLYIIRISTSQGIKTVRILK